MERTELLMLLRTLVEKSTVALDLPGDESGAERIWYVDGDRLLQLINDELKTHTELKRKCGHVNHNATGTDG